MQLIPAIDLRHGTCVRLYKGDFEQETRYDADPVELAQRYRDAGAEWLHIVDLDGAKSGHPQNLGLIERMGQIEGLRTQTGGGIRDRRSLAAALKAADRVVIGSLAVSAPDTVKAWMQEFGAQRFTLGFDVRLDDDGRAWLTTHGWTETSATDLGAAIDDFVEFGLRHVLCTDVDKDGAMAGPNFALYRQCVERWPGIAFQASGGVRGVDDLVELDRTGVSGAISGRALLDGRFSKAEMQRFLPNA